MLFFFFNDTATTEIYTLSLHDALPISVMNAVVVRQELGRALEPLGSSRDVARGNVRHSQIEGRVWKRRLLGQRAEAPDGGCVIVGQQVEPPEVVSDVARFAR